MSAFVCIASKAVPVSRAPGLGRTALSLALATGAMFAAPIGDRVSARAGDVPDIQRLIQGPQPSLEEDNRTERLIDAAPIGEWKGLVWRYADADAGRDASSVEHRRRFARLTRPQIPRDGGSVGRDRLFATPGRPAAHFEPIRKAVFSGEKGS